jgi:sugar lactone lactonase YvrE
MNKASTGIILVVTAFLALSANGQNGGLPEIFAGASKQIAKATTVAEFPANTFLENIAVAKNGDLFVTSLEDGKIFRVKPSGEKSEFIKIDGKIAGITFGKGSQLIVTGWAEGKTPSIFVISGDGRLQSTTAIDGAVFLNGIIPFEKDLYLIADSYRGAIWQFDGKTKKYGIWLEDASLSRNNASNPFPGVNGLRRRNGDLYITNTEQQKIYRIPISSDGRPGTSVLFAKDVNGDDFAFDESGNLFVTTHVYNSVVKIDPKGKVSIVAEQEQGAAGSTSLAFGRGKAGKSIYFVTNGGMSLPPAGGVQAAKVVRLELTNK